MNYKLLVSLIISIAIFNGCAIDPHYNAEKAFWHAEQKAKKILRNSKNKPSKQDFQNIIREYKKVVKIAPLAPLSLKAKDIIINIYLSQKKYEEVHFELKSIIENFSINTRVASQSYFKNGKIYELEKKFNEAYLEYEKIIDLYPASIVGLNMPIYLLEFYKNHKQNIEYKWTFEQAERHYLSIINEFKETSQENALKNYLLKLYFKEEKWEKIINFWNEAGTKDDANTPLIMRAAISRANIYSVKMNQTNKAIKILKDLAEKYQKHPYTKHVQLRLVNIYQTERNFIEANKILHSIIETYPDEKDIIIQCKLKLISILKDENKNEIVISEYKKIQEEYPDNINTLSIPFSLYSFYKQLDHAETAKQLLKAIEQYEPLWKNGQKEKKDLVAGQLLLFCYAQKKDYNKMIILLDELNARFPKDPRFLFTKAELYKNKLHNIEKTKEVLAQILKKYPNNQKLKYIVQAMLAEMQSEKKLSTTTP